MISVSNCVRFQQLSCEELCIVQQQNIDSVFCFVLYSILRASRVEQFASSSSSRGQFAFF